MKPIKFKEQNATLLGEKGSDVGRLPVCKTEKEWISCWKLSFMDKIRALVYGRIWICLYSKKAHPPVSVACIQNVFKKIDAEPSKGRRAHRFPKKRKKHGR